MKIDRAEQEEQRRQRIARVAFELFARSGLDQTSAQDIARAAYVSRTNLYRYFPSKAHMLLAHFEQTLAETRAEALRRLSDGTAPQVVWQLVTRRMADLGVRYQHLVGVVGQAVLGLPTQTGFTQVTLDAPPSEKAVMAEHNLNPTQNEQMRTALMLVALVEPPLRAMQMQGHVRAGADTHLLASLFVDACLLALLHGGHRDQYEVLKDWQERFSFLMQGALAPGCTLGSLLDGPEAEPSLLSPTH